MKIFKLTMPFSLLAVFFIAIGIILNDTNQIIFGFVWAILATLAYIMKKRSFNNRS